MNMKKKLLKSNWVRKKLPQNTNGNGNGNMKRGRVYAWEKLNEFMYTLD